MSIDDPKAAAILDRALRALIRSINAPLVHPSDKGRTIELFRWLLENGIAYSADGVRAWFKANYPAWPEEEILAIAAGVLAGRKFRVGIKGPFWNEEFLKGLLRPDER